MRIVIATPILFDSDSPFNHLFKDILGGLLEEGDKITRLVAVRDEIEDGYKFGYGNIKYIKYKRKESAHSNIISRYVLDTLTNIREAYGIAHIESDLLFEDASYSSYWSVRAAKKSGKRVVLMVQDVWPDNAVQSGLIRENSLIYRYFETLQEYVYRKSDNIICISDDMKDFIVSKGIDPAKVSVIYNWGYGDDVIDIPWEKNKFVKKYSLYKDFYAVYAGNIGKMQNVELIIRAAKRMPDTQFLIVGDGANKEGIIKKADNAKNIRFLPFQPKSLAEHIYSMAGVNIIPLVEGGTKTAMPSKTGVVLSCGNPVIFCFGNGTRFSKLVSMNGAGKSVSPTDEMELIEEIQRIKKSSFSKNYDLFLNQFRRTDNIKKYMEVVHDA